MTKKRFGMGVVKALKAFARDKRNWIKVSDAAKGLNDDPTVIETQAIRDLVTQEPVGARDLMAAARIKRIHTAIETETMGASSFSVQAVDVASPEVTKPAPAAAIAIAPAAVVAPAIIEKFFRQEDAVAERRRRQVNEELERLTGLAGYSSWIRRDFGPEAKSASGGRYDNRGRLGPYDPSSQPWDY
jgi:hypothetical protein